MTRITRTTVDLSGFPDLVVVYLGMKPSSLRGLKAMGRTRKEIQASVAARPDSFPNHRHGPACPGHP